MRRVATFAATVGITVTGIGAAAAAGPASASPVAGRPGLAGGPLGTVPAKAVRYHGYVISVPAGWPVFRLGRDPSRCVRYDINALYLGRPGPSQRCPAHLVGRADTVSLQAHAGKVRVRRPHGPAPGGAAGASPRR